jgi:hypothetical protein
MGESQEGIAMPPSVSFNDLIGKQVLAFIPIFDDNTFHEITIHGVETGGLWVESAHVSKAWLEKLQLPAIKTPLFFVPFHEIRFVLHSAEKLELSEKKFGL